MRDDAGKEVRYPIILSAHEKDIARRICVAFKATVCGFDLLRSEGASLVCDVNGWSFVKNSPRFYADAASIIAGVVLSRVAPWAAPRTLGATPRPPGDAPAAVAPTDTGVAASPDEELLCVIGIMRHGDRHPKQKLKLRTRHPLILEFLRAHAVPPKCARPHSPSPLPLVSRKRASPQARGEDKERNTPTVSAGGANLLRELATQMTLLGAGHTGGARRRFGAHHRWQSL